MITNEKERVANMMARLNAPRDEEISNIKIARTLDEALTHGMFSRKTLMANKNTKEDE